MSRSFKLIAAVMAVSICALAAGSLAAAKSGNETWFAKLTGDGRGVAIVELRGKKKVCITVSMRKYEPERAEIKAHGKKGKIKIDENGKKECDKEKKLSERLSDGDHKGKTQATIRGGGDRSHGKLRSGFVSGE